jgi:putative sterol carrier protein
MSNKLFEDYKAMVREKTTKFDVKKWGDKVVSLVYAVSGEGGGNWEIKVTGDGVIIDENGPEQGDLTFSMDVETMHDMVYNDLDTGAAFVKGKIKMKGKKSLLFKLRDVLG